MCHKHKKKRSAKIFVLDIILSGKGFTLLELLVSLTILGIAFAIISGSLFVGINAWEKGEESIERNQRLRVVSDLIRSQIVSATFRKKIKNKEGELFYLQGSPKSLELASVISILFYASESPVFVRYNVLKDEQSDKEELFLEEQKLNLSDTVDIEPKDDMKTRRIKLLTADKIVFEYLKSENGADDGKWIEEWGDSGKTSLPKAIKICLRIQNKTVCVVARLHSIPNDLRNL